jgi:hypothetical protein
MIGGGSIITPKYF